jgi:ribonuclease Z
MHFGVTILGCNGGVPTHHRHASSQYIDHLGKGYLIDCGEGTQMQMQQYHIRPSRIEHIFISHLHGDHFYGLIGLLSSLNLYGREAPMHIYGPAAIAEIIAITFSHSMTTLQYPIHYHHTQATTPEIILDTSRLTVETIPLQHRIPTTGFLFREKTGLRKMITEQILAYNIAGTDILAIKQGADYTTATGELIPNELLTLDPAAPRSYAYCSDTAYTESILEQIAGVDLLYHEATFMHEHRDRARETMHSTTREAATIASKAKAGRLIIGHYSSRYDKLDQLCDEAREVYAHTNLAIEGVTYLVQRT